MYGRTELYKQCKSSMRGMRDRQREQANESDREKKPCISAKQKKKTENRINADNKETTTAMTTTTASKKMMIMMTTE